MSKQNKIFSSQAEEKADSARRQAEEKARQDEKKAEGASVHKAAQHLKVQIVNLLENGLKLLCVRVSTKLPRPKKRQNPLVSRPKKMLIGVHQAVKLPNISRFES